ncbi:hypothetical protein F441_20059, partial [Phytophthora nicotianae CJ01A1]
MSSDSNVFVDLTSSPGSSPRSAPRGSLATVSTIELADPSLDLASVRASLSALPQSVDQVETLHELCSDHENLRRNFLTTRLCAKDLDRQLADAANAASPYVLFCQRKYDLVRHQLESTQTKLAECLDALQERFDNSHELEACRLRYRDLEIRYNEVVSEFLDRICTLEAQLAAASSFDVISRGTASLPPLLESATSRKAAQAEVTRLEAAIEHKTRRLRTLRDKYERRLRVADTTITTHTTELGRLQDRVSTLDRDLQKASQRVQRIVSQRLEILSPGWKGGLTKSRGLRSRVRTSSPCSQRFSGRETLWRFKEMKLGQLGERFMEGTDLGAERDQAQERLSNIASFLPSAPGHKRARSEAESPAQSTRVSKAARSTSHLSQASTSSHAPASGSSIEVLSAVAAGQKAKGSVLSPSSAGPPDHLPRSVRSTAKSSSGGASSSPAASEAGAHTDGGESSSGEYSSSRVCDSDAAGSDSSSPELSRAKNKFGMPSGPLSDAELATLPPTTVPRSEWLPGYRDRRSFRGHDIVPWSAQDIRQTSIVEMDADLLFHHYTKPMEWLIPLRDPVPQSGEWRDDPVDENNVRDLIESAPWKILAAP